jgi:hypothetical protein
VNLPKKVTPMPKPAKYQTANCKRLQMDNPANPHH